MARKWVVQTFEEPCTTAGSSVGGATVDLNGDPVVSGILWSAGEGRCTACSWEPKYLLQRTYIVCVGP